MAQAAATAWRRSEPRFRVAGGAVVTVTPSEDETGSGREHHGIVTDLSLRGMRVALDARLPIGQMIAMRLTIPEIQLDLVVEGVVRSSEPRDRKTWWLGCSLVEPLTPTLIEDLSVAGVLDRRQDTRDEISRTAQVQWPLSDEIMDVELLDYSRGGFRLQVAGHEPVAGERVMLILRDDDQVVRIPARVRWSKPTETGHRLGCSFTTRDGYLLFGQALELTDATHVPHRLAKRRRRLPLNRWVGVAMVVLASLQALRLLDTEPQWAALVRHGFQQFIVRPIASMTDHVAPTTDRD